MVWENFQICSVQITGNAFSSQKIDSRHFILKLPRPNFHPGSYHHPQDRGKLLIPSTDSGFFKKICFTREKKGRVTMTAVVQFGIYDLNDA